jgi:tetratricopeptide (TPR) repeat protein
MTSTLRIFVSSPGDVGEERLLARRILSRLEAEFGGTVALETFFWEHEPLLASASFQAQIPRPSETDIAISILWSRLGTRLAGSFRKADGQGYASGTEYEFEDALAGFRRSGRPDLLVYRKTAPVELPSAEDPGAVEIIAQKRALDDFFKRWFHDASDGHLRAAFHPFAGPSDFEELLEIHLRKLIRRRIPELAPSERQVATWRHGSPFRGLEAFGPEHADVFFGRTRAVADCISRLRRQAQRRLPFLLITGMSGSGKSSLVHAGVVPLLTQPGVVEGHARWQHGTLRPSSASGDLIGALADAWGSLTSIDRSDAERLLRSSFACSPPEMPSPDRHGDSTPLLVLDQLEEAFTDARVTEAERRAFFRALYALCRAGTWIVATMRNDFYAECGGYAELHELRDGLGTFDLPSPDAGELGQLIRRPAAAAGLSFDIDVASGQSLDEVLRDEAIASPEALPLLQFTLQELYDQRSENGTLTFSAYRAIGGVAGALARRAEAEFSALPAAAQAALPAVFQAAVVMSPDSGQAGRRAAVPLDTMQPSARELAARFIDARLFTSSSGPDGRRVFGIAHEALVRQWPRLVAWTEDNKDLLRVRQRVATAASRWVAEGRRNDLLLAPGKQVDEAASLLAAGMALTEDERAMVEGSLRRARRNRLVRWGAIASLVALAITAVGAAIVADNQRKRAETEASTTRQTIEFMVGMFAQADPEENRGSEISVREVLDKGAARIDTELQAQPKVRSSLMTAMGRVYANLGLYEPATRLLTEAVSGYAQDSGADSNALRAELELAKTRYLSGDYASAISSFQSVVERARAQSDPPGPLVTEAMNGWADCLVQEGDLEQAEPLYREALAIDRALHGQVHDDVARSLNGLGYLHFFAGRYAEAEARFREALDIRLRLHGERHAAVAESLNNVASAQYQAGNFAEASATLQRALPVYRTIYGNEHPEVGTALNNLGRSLLMAGDIANAEPLFTEALRIDRARKPAGHDDFIAPLNSLGMIAMAQGDFGIARRYLEEALAIARKHDHWLLSQVLANMADLASRERRYADALPHIAECRSILARDYPRGSDAAEEWRHAIVDSIEGLVRAVRDQDPSTIPLLESARDTLESRFGAGSLYDRDAEMRLSLARQVLTAKAGNQSR